MYLRLLQIRDISDVNRYLTLVASVERARGRADSIADFGQHMAPDLVERATTAALGLSGRENDPAARDGYGDVIRLVMDHASEIPFTESQIKYFHSQLLRHDSSAAGHRRQYRRPGIAPDPSSSAWAVGSPPSAEVAAAEMPKLVAWTRETLETGQLHPLLPISVFLCRFLCLRPFVSGNVRLALALAVYLLDSYGYSHVRVASLEEILAEHRDAGAAALEEALGDREDATAWVHFLLDAVHESQQRALESSGATPIAARLTPRQTRLLDAMRERGAAKIGDLLPILQTPRATLKKDLRSLVDAGYLVSQGVRKGTVYHVRD